YDGNTSGDVSGGSLINITAITTDVSCFGGADGTGTILAADGTPPYSYTWPPSAGNQITQEVTNLSAGSYIVTVTDSGDCEGTVTVDISEPTQLAPLASVVDDILCRGEASGSVTVNTGGGTPPYVLLWTGGSANQTLTGLLAGTYTVTVTDGNGCTATSSTTVSEPAQDLLATISATTNVDCFGGNNGSATAVGSGGTGPYSYAWSNGQMLDLATGLAAGTHTVTVTDANSCTTTTTAVITEPSELTASISAQTNVLCKGAATGSASIAVSGGTISYTYLWPVSAGSQTTATAVNLLAGTYTATVTDGQDCTVTVTATITEPATSLTVMVVGTNVSCGGAGDGSAIANPSGGTPGYTYLWSTGELTANAINLNTGTYTVTVTDQNGCTVSSMVTIGQNTGSVSYKLTLDPDGQTYRVSFNSSVAYNGALARITGSSQFTIVFPDPDGAGPGVIQLTNVTALTDLDFDYSQLNHPAENPGKDYTFFAPTNAGSYTLFNIPANTDIELFTFQIVGGCAGSVSLFENYADPLNDNPNISADNAF
ncbi:MAG: SprB repeat-containing protein, partial [Saprospiraceae bacterium]|nr:SprB repeat-containing protein [Saprospiraceae bacterium]